MFFQFTPPPQQPGPIPPEQPRSPADFNSDGSPKWLRDQEGHLILNDPALTTLLKTEDGFPEAAELTKSMTLRTGAWTPVTT